MAVLILLTVFIVAICSLIYHLIFGTLASYIHGDSLLQYSLTLGIYFFCMGIGALLSSRFKKHPVDTLIFVEILTGLFGSSSGLLAYWAMPFLIDHSWVLHVFLGLTGVCVGMEIPILILILKDKTQLKELVSKVYSIDYASSLVASLAFPFILMPYLGVAESSIVLALLNVGVACVLGYFFKKDIYRKKSVLALCVGSVVWLCATLYFQLSNQKADDEGIYFDTVYLQQKNEMGREVITHHNGDFAYFRNGQFLYSSLDIPRYFETLTQPLLEAVQPRSVLIIGDFFGKATQQVLAHSGVRVLTIVTPAEKKNILPEHTSQNTPHLQVYQQEPWSFLEATTETFDAVILSVEDPSHYKNSLLYTLEFFRLIKSRLSPSGGLALQASSPVETPAVFQSIYSTVKHVFFNTIPLKTWVPNLGEWGFLVALQRENVPLALNSMPQGQYLNSESFKQMFTFSKYVSPPFPTKSAINTLQNRIIPDLYATDVARGGLRGIQ